jgi:hypothetical protein
MYTLINTKGCGRTTPMLNRAETEGFEPSEPVRARLVSSEVLSTTQPRLQYHIS